MRSQDFHALSRSVQERFVAAVTRRTDPAPLAEIRVRAKERLVWIATVVLGVVLLVAVWRQGFGDPQSTFVLQGRGALIVYVIATAAIALAAQFEVRYLANFLPSSTKTAAH